MAAPVHVVESVSDAGLVYTTDASPGITRVRLGDAFAYLGVNGKQVRDGATLERIRALAIPPAWEEVWICPIESGHLQATGRDARGRKQYRYHPRFRDAREEWKYERMIEFGKALPQIRQRLHEDLSKRGLPREKVLAAVVTLLEKSLIRVGNEEYAKENKSFGLTTLRNRHVQIEGSQIHFKFLGKSGTKHRITLQNPRLARIVKRIQELPGQDLFQYLDEDGNRHSVGSSDVNAYLRQISGADFTAKDFRTWAGTVLAILHLVEEESPSSSEQTKKKLSAAIKAVAQHLGNTPAICRKCYVHPAVIETYTEGDLHRLLLGRETDRAAVAGNEELVVRFLERAARSKRAKAARKRAA
jgi:DNA topoisomerase I